MTKMMLKELDQRAEVLGLYVERGTVTGPLNGNRLSRYQVGQRGLAATAGFETLAQVALWLDQREIIAAPQ